MQRYFDLQAGQRVEFNLNHQKVQGIVTDDEKIVVMQLDSKGSWYPNFIPIYLLEHVTFDKIRRKSMPLYEDD